MHVLTLALAIGICAISASAETWKFAVMSDTQWSNAADAANNPGTVAVGIINQLNKQFIAHGVKFVVQVGDLDDKETNYTGLPQTPRIGISTRAAAAQALYDAGIGFFPLRGNHEGSQTAAGEMPILFPQTQGSGPYVFGASNFSSPSINLAGLSYSFDFNNARFILLDQFTPTDGKASDGTTYSQGNNAISSQQPWISSTLGSKSTDSHAFIFSHKQLFGGNHTDTLFNTAASNASKQNAFINSLYANSVGYLFSGHDHMHNYSIVTSPDGTSKVRQVICASNSYKFYTPVSLSNHGTDAAGTGYPNAGQISKNRETEISQELWSTGYYIVTVDGLQVTVDFYSADPTPGPGLADIDLSTTPALTFSRRETFGYSLNGQEYLVPQGQPYTSVNETYNSTEARILSGTNGNTSIDYNGRPLVKAVHSGWAPAELGLASNIFALSGMTDGLTNNIPYVERDTTLTDTFALSMSYNPGAVIGNTLSGNFGLAVRDKYRGWVNAVSKNFGGTPNFVAGPWVEGYGLGTYGVDTTTNTAWAVINHNSDFAIGEMSPDNVAPSVAIVVPALDEVFDAPASITITANAIDSDGTVAKVEFYNGAEKIGEAVTAPFTMTWNGILSGNYTLSAVATDNEGMQAPSASITILVNNLNNVLPTVALPAPVDGASVFAGNAVALAATAADTDGFVTKVEFYAGATKLGEDTTAPYSFNWTAAAIGDYELAAVAIDNDGASAMSLIAHISVVAVPSGGTASFFENFDPMGTAGTVPPTGWSIKNANSGTSNSTWSAASIPANGGNSVASMVNASGSLTATTTPTSTNNNGYNAAAGGNTTDRMIATSPTSVAGVAIQLQLLNNSGGYINQLVIGYDIYRINATSSVNELPGYQLFYSLDNGTTWTNIQPLNPTVSGPNGIIVPNTIGMTNVLPTPVTLSGNWNPGNPILFRWVDDNGVPTSPDQMYGLDNVSINTPVSLQSGMTTSSFVYSRAARTYNGTMTLTNMGQAPIQEQIFVSLTNLTPGVTLKNASGMDNGAPYIAIDLAGDLNPGESISFPLSFNNPSNAKINFAPVTYQ